MNSKKKRIARSSEIRKGNFYKTIKSAQDRTRPLKQDEKENMDDNNKIMKSDRNINVPNLKVKIIPDLTVMNYKISVQVPSGVKNSLNTENTNVFVHLHGEFGDSGRRILFMPTNHSDQKFQPGNVIINFLNVSYWKYW